MATLYDMQTRLRHFYNLKEDLNSVITYINNSIDDLNPSVKNILMAYSVDENSKASTLLSKNLENLISKRDFIKNTVIPEINLEISKLKKMIEEEQLKLT